jgi:type I restriction enzyme R subunit
MVKDTTKETDARIVIDDWLRLAGWDHADKSQVQTEFKADGGFSGVAHPGATSDPSALRTSDGDEVPTGTGKTDLICQYIERLMQAGHTERVLFLVDREQLAKQALEAITEHHAARLAQYLNELHPEHNGRDAEVITSDVQHMDVLIR